MPEIVLIHVGQAGVQIGSACWELLCIEHGINPSGHMQNECAGDVSYKAFFHETAQRKFRPRAVFVDLEPSVIDEIRNDVYHSLFSDGQLISGCEDSANSFARGYCTVGREILIPTLRAIEAIVEQCEDFVGFIIMHSMGGGTGSGFTTLLMESLKEMYEKKTILEFAVYPSPKLSTSIVEPYNAVLMTHPKVEIADCVFLMDNEALYDICNNLLHVDQPTYININRIVAQVISGITSSLRFEGAINVDLMEFQTNLVPFPKMHFPLVSYAPFIPVGEADDYSVVQITKQCLSADNQMIKCNYREGNYIACCLLYRGSIAPNHITDAITTLKSKGDIRFVSWVPTGIKVGINYQPPAYVPGGDLASVCTSVCMVANTTAIKEVWTRLRTKFEIMFADRAFVHWYTSEGMEEDDFMEALANIALLEKQYDNVENIEPGGGVITRDTSREIRTTAATVPTVTTIKPQTTMQYSKPTSVQTTSAATMGLTAAPSEISSSSSPTKTTGQSAVRVRRSMLDRIPFSTDGDEQMKASNNEQNNILPRNFGLKCSSKKKTSHQPTTDDK